MLGPFLIFLTIFNTAVLFVASKPDALASFSGNPFLSLGQAAALIGFTLMCGTLVISARSPRIEKWFGGMDRMYRWHAWVSTASFVLLLNHPLMLALHRLPSPHLIPRLFLPGNDLAYNFGILSLYTFILLIVLTVYSRLPYHIWRFTHMGMGLAATGGMVHSLLISSDISRFLPLRIWMIILMGAGVLSILYRRLLHRFTNPSYPYRIQKATQTRDVLHIHFTPTSSRSISFIPGQFVFVSFPEVPGLSEPHPFSIVSAPDSDQLRVSIKMVGDFTKHMSRLKEGDTAHIQGPFGGFAPLSDTTLTRVYIAGGIGITPFIGALSKSHHSASTYVFYSVRDKTQAYFDEELEQLTSHHKFIYHLHISSQEGHLTAQEIAKSVPDISQAVFYLCGPNALIDTLKSQLRYLKVKSSRIIYEDFSFR